MAYEYKVKPLPYAYNALDGISEQTNRYHHDTHYAGYVNKRNEIEKRLDAIDRNAANANWSEYGELKRRETWNADGQVLHEIYWDVLGGDGKPAGSILDQIGKDFGSLDAWRADFVASAKVALGWVVLAYDPSCGRLVNFIGDVHNQGGLWGASPLLPIDVFEHAYYHDQGPARPKYIEAFLKNVKWSEVDARWKKVAKTARYQGHGQFQVKPLPYAYNARNGISEQTNKFHHDTHYAGYVNKRNEIERALSDVNRDDANANWSLFQALKGRETFNANGIWLHELYWDTLGGNGEPTGKVLEQMKKDFGSFENWKADFVAAAKIALGWVVLAYDRLDGRLHNYTGDLHNQGVVWGAEPLLPIDVFEHAYYHDQGPARPKYIDAFVANVNWKKVDEIFASAR
jgi:Fe-Mn family superoxide dismutase